MKKLLATAFLLFLSPLAQAADESPLSREIEVSINGQTQTVTLEELGIGMQGTKEKFWERAFSSVLFFNKVVKGPDSTYTWNPVQSEHLIRWRWGLPVPQDAFFTWDGQQLSLMPAVPGDSLDVEKILNKITSQERRDSFRFESEPTVVLAEEALQSHETLAAQLLSPGLTIHVNTETLHFPAQLKDLQFTPEGLVLSGEFMDYVLSTLEKAANRPSEDLKILEADPTQLSRTKTEGHVRDGQLLLLQETKTTIEDGLQAGRSETPAITRVIPGRVLNFTGQTLGPLEHLATGRSNFEGSIPGRDFNVQKAINQHLNGILVPPGAEFAFNQFLDGPITLSNGWKQAFAIFLGTQLELVPGGGICQSSTTMYRAALNAGMEITDHRTHSIYVDYYDKYGKGLDATIFPGEQDFKFINNTPNFLFIEAYTEGKDAVINFYGADDGREVTLEGPYTTSNQTEEVIAGVGQPLRYYQVAWKYVITQPDGTATEKWLLSTYGSGVTQEKKPQP